MGIKLISHEGDFLGCLLHMHERGEDVKAYIQDPKAKKMHDNLLPKADGPYDLKIQPDDIVVFDMVGAGKEADTLKRKGYQVIGGGSFQDKIELCRKDGEQLMHKVDIRTPPSYGFCDFNSAREFIAEKPDRYVFKPDGNLDTNLTYVASSAENLLRMLPYLEDRCGRNTPFTLEQFVPGIEMSTEGWFNGRRFLRPFNSTMEEKKLLVGGLGPNTGCMGNAVWVWAEEYDEVIYRLLFQKLERELESIGYLGPIDINAIWTDDGPYGLEFTARFGYDAIQALDQLISESLEHFLYTLPSRAAMPEPVADFSLAIRVSIPPYPHGHGEVPELPIGGITPRMKSSLYLSDVYLSNDGLKSAGSDGYILCAASPGPTPVFIQKKLHKMIDKIEVPDKQYRTDIGDRVINDKAAVENILKKL